MLVWVLADNPATRFYEAMGCKRIGSKTDEIGGKKLEEYSYSRSIGT